MRALRATLVHSVGLGRHMGFVRDAFILSFTSFGRSVFLSFGHFPIEVKILTPKEKPRSRARSNFSVNVGRNEFDEYPIDYMN